MYIALIEIVDNCIVFIRKAALLFNVRNKYYIIIIQEQYKNISILKSFSSSAEIL